MRINIMSSRKNKQKSLKYLLIAVLCFSILAFIICFIISSISIFNVTHPIREEIKPFSSNIVPEFSNISFKDIGGKVPLKGWFFESKGSPKTVILVHGQGKNRMQYDLKTLDMIKQLLGKRYNVLAFDLRNSGESGEAYSTFGVLERNDVLGAVKYIKNRGSKQIVLIGFSTGATASLLASAESTDINAIVADSPTANVQDYVSEYFSTFSKLPRIPFNYLAMLNMRLFNKEFMEYPTTVAAVKKIKSSHVFFIHNENDKNVPISNSVELYNVYTANSNGIGSIWKSNTKGHSQTYLQDSDAYIQKVSEFLDKALK